MTRKIGPDAVITMQKEMSFVDHLSELRSRILKCLIAVLVCSGLCYRFWEKILRLLTGYPLHRLQPPPELIYTGPTEGFMISIKIALFSGLLSAAPFVFFQFWRFTAPGLFQNEKKQILPLILFSTFFFLSGIAFSYRIVLPIAFDFLMNCTPAPLRPLLSIDHYIGFVVKFMAAFGLVFELPVLAFIFARMGILTAAFLRRNFRYAVILIFILAAILTPPDVFSQTLMALPLLALYLLCIPIAHFARSRHA